MAYGGFNNGGRTDPGRMLTRSLFRWGTLAVVFAIHAAVIFLPLLWGGCRHDKVREERFKVKLGGSELSHAPEVGQPERLRPTTASPSETAPAPQEPSVKVPPKKPTPAPKEPKVVKPKVRPKPVPKEPKAVKPKVRQKPTPVPKEPKVKPDRNRNKRNSREQAANKPSRTRQNTRNVKPREDDGIYHPPGGNNFNQNVKIGSRDAGQRRGPADHRTPQAGREDQADQEWQSRVQKYVEMCWNPPENVFWGDNPPTAVLRLVIAADGRVLRATLIKSSGNARMDGTIRQLIQQLNGRPAPKPPHGMSEIEVELIPNK